MLPADCCLLLAACCCSLSVVALLQEVDFDWKQFLQYTYGTRLLVPPGEMLAVLVFPGNQSVEIDASDVALRDSMANQRFMVFDLIIEKVTKYTIFNIHNWKKDPEGIVEVVQTFYSTWALNKDNKFSDKLVMGGDWNLPIMNPKFSATIPSIPTLYQNCNMFSGKLIDVIYWFDRKKEIPAMPAMCSPLPLRDYFLRLAAASIVLLEAATEAMNIAYPGRIVLAACCLLLAVRRLRMQKAIIDETC